MNKTERCEGAVFIVCSMAALVFFHLAYLSGYNETGVIGGAKGYNLFVYAGGVLLFFLCYLTGSFGVRYLPDGERLKKLFSFLYLIFVAGALLFLYWIYEKETTWFAGYALGRTFMREQIKHVPFTCLMLFLIFTTYFGIRGGNSRQEILHCSSLPGCPGLRGSRLCSQYISQPRMGNASHSRL